MPTNMTPDQMKRLVREHFEDFVNNRKGGSHPQEHDCRFL